MLVGNAGVLLTRVEYLKHGEEKNFAIVDAAMNDLMRPALYDAYHEILPVEHEIRLTPHPNPPPLAGEGAIEKNMLQSLKWSVRSARQATLSAMRATWRSRRNPCWPCFLLVHTG